MDKNGVKRLITIIMTLFIQVLVMFLGAGKIGIERIWFFLFVNLVYLLASFAVILFVFLEKADIINQRGKYKKDTKNWDLIIISTISLISLIIVPACIGFDLGRYHWSSLSMGYFYGLLPFYLASQAFGQWALIANPHFEPTVRIQSDRDHQVVQNGPYRFMRHPGYLSFITSSVITPIMLGSLIALIPTLVIVVLFIIRTIFEDRTLKNELEGYKNYAERVRYRIIPYVW
jgi:protein-S-isoprenylcysteine O-methyltransferase Ste14